MSRFLLYTAALLSLIPLTGAPVPEWNESFENGLKGIRILSWVNGKYTATPSFMSRSCSKLKAYTGQHALELNCSDPRGSHHIDHIISAPAVRTGVRLDFRYLVASAEGKNNISGRIVQLDAKGKWLKPFSFFRADPAPGNWRSSGLTVYPKPECKKLQVTIWISGKQRVFVDDISFGPLPAEKSATPERAEILAETPELTWFAAPADRKIRRSGIPEKRIKVKELFLQGAKGEKCSILLAVAPKKKLDQVEVRLSLPGIKNISHQTLGFIYLKNPANPAMKGWLSDPLLPEKSGPGTPGINNCFYVEFNIPRDFSSGVHSGSVDLLVNGRKSLSAPLKLKVRSFALPELPIYRTHMPIRPHNGFLKFDNRSPETVSLEMLAHCANYRINPQTGYPLPAPRFTVKEGHIVKADWSGFDKALSDVIKKYKFTRVRLPLPCFGAYKGWFAWFPGRIPTFLGEKLFGGRGLELLAEAGKLYSDHMKEKFPGVTGYAFLYDEPPTDYIPYVIKIQRAFTRNAPHIKVYLTGNNQRHFLDSVQAFCIPLGPGYLWSKEEIAALRPDQELWYYNWYAPLDWNTYMNNRLYPWRSYAAGGTGGLAWHSNHTGKTNSPVNPWTNMEQTYECGVVSLFYPARKKGESLIASVRLAHRGKSLDDYDYIKLLEQAIDRDFPGKGKTRVMELITKLIPEPPFSRVSDPDLLEYVRNRMGDEIEAAALAPKALLTSLPREYTKVVTPEVKVTLYALPGTHIAVKGGKSGTTDASGRITLPVLLQKNGINRIEFTVTRGKKSKKMFREYTLLPDPNLMELRKLAKNLDKEGQALLKETSKGIYSEMLRRKVAEKLTSFRLNEQKKRLKKVTSSPRPLARAFAAQAQKCMDFGFFKQTERYLALAEKSARLPDLSKTPVSLVPFTRNGHSGLRIANNRVSAELLETGGRMISFKIDGVECFATPVWKRVLPLKERLKADPDPAIVTKLPEYGGMEDSHGDSGRWPVSAVNWNVELIDLSPQKIIIGFSADIPGTAFHIRRAMTLKANDNKITMDYTVKNNTLPDMKSDDPSSFQFSWRMRLVPGIGSDGAANDTLGVPVVKALPRLSIAGTPFFYTGLYPITLPVLGGCDKKAGAGFVVHCENITHAYLWVNNKNRQFYTLEMPRSYFMTSAYDPKRNTPYTILPGKELNFRAVLTGFSGKTWEKEWGKFFKKGNKQK